MPRMNFASSDIRSGDHGGSHVSSTSTASTPSISLVTRWMSSWIIGPTGQPLDVVEQAEVDDVHPELGILDLAQRLDHLVLRRHRASSVAGASSRAGGLPP